MSILSLPQAYRTWQAVRSSGCKASPFTAASERDANGGGGLGIMSITILFEQAGFLAADKPEGIPSIPERDLALPSLVRMLEEERGKKLYVVHRLDKEASGVMLFAKDAAAHKWLNDLFAERRIRKTYLLLAHGIISGESGRIDKPLRQFGSGRMGVDATKGRESVTEFRVRERFSRHTLIEAHPLTGRRHQLRVHFYSIGHPLAGDLRYGDRSLQQGYPRLLLHAWRIEIPLASGGHFTVESPVPDSFTSAITGARNDAGGSTPDGEERGNSPP